MANTPNQRPAASGRDTTLTLTITPSAFTTRPRLMSPLMAA
jgi:hypothetical protein